MAKLSIQDLQEIISPKFTEKVVLEIITKKSGLAEIELKNILAGAASKKGDSYLSDICRFTVEAVGKNKVGLNETIIIPVIVKYLPKNIARRKTYRSVDFFENEIIFYDKVWQQFQNFQVQTEIKDKFDNIPLVLSSYLDSEDGFVAMFDLTPEGYKSAERGTGLNEEHTCAILKLLAQFHGLSLAFKEKQPEEFEKAALNLKETYFSERLRPWYSNFQKNVFAIIRDAVKKELPYEYLQKLDNILEQDLYGLLIKSCIVRGPLSVITHGDVWVPNFLIKYEAHRPGRLTMIDFQLARYTTLVTDLAFFLFSCVSAEIIATKWDTLIEYYHNVLAESMQKYGCKNVVTLDQINSELKEHSIMGVGMSMEALIMCQLDDDDVSDLDAIEGIEAVPLENVWLIHPFQETEKRKRIASMIKLAADKNFI